MVRARRVLGMSVLAIALIGCVGAPSATTGFVVKPSPTARPAGELIQVGQVTYATWGERDVRGAKIREMDAGDSYFRGTFLRGEPGQQLILTIDNVANQGHNFSLPAQGLDQHLPPRSDRVDVVVTFPQSGGLQFFCKHHTAEGMNGCSLSATRRQSRWPVHHL